MPPQGPPQGAPQGPGGPPQGGGPDDANQMIKIIQDGLNTIVQAIGPSSPPEAQKLLQTASDAFNQYVDMVSGGAAKPQGAQPPQSEMTAGNPNARPMM